MPHPSGRPWIAAHRGACRVRAENTVEAFEMARELGADAVEFDVRRTADGKLVVVHDASLPGWTRPIIQMTRAELRAAAPHIPDLEEAISACAGMWVDIEIKNAPFEPDWDPEGGAAAEVADRVAAIGRSADSVISSFDPAAVTAAVAAGARAGLLVVREMDPVDALDLVDGIEFLLPSATAMAGDGAERVVSAAETRAVEVGVWTVDEPEEMRRLADAGVGVVFTNEPSAAVAALA